MSVDRETAERIRRMAEYFPEEEIAAVFNLPVDVVADVLRGEIEPVEDAGESAPKVKVVEKARFVRNRTVTAISAGGGTGKTVVLVSLALAAAVHSPGGRPVVVADLAEFARAAPALGLRQEDGWPTLVDFGPRPDRRDVIERLTVRHPLVDNLHVLPGVAAADALDFRPERLTEIVSILRRHFEIVFVDPPWSRPLCEPLLAEADAVLLVAAADRLSVTGIGQIVPTLLRLELSDRTFLVLNRVGLYMDKAECRKLVASMFSGAVQAAAYVPEEPELHRALARGSHVFLEKPDLPFCAEVRHLLWQLCPDWRRQPEGGRKGFLGRLIGGMFA